MFYFKDYDKAVEELSRLHDDNQNLFDLCEYRINRAGNTLYKEIEYDNYKNTSYDFAEEISDWYNCEENPDNGVNLVKVEDAFYLAYWDRH